MEKKILFIVCALYSFLSKGQVSFYQDVYRGGICVTGTATGLASGSATLPYYIESGSSIRKVFLITYETTHETVTADDFNVIIDGIPFNQNQLDNHLFFSQNLIDGHVYTGQRTHISDITNDIVFTGGDVSILMNAQFPDQPCPSCIYSAPMIVILYENNSLPTINVLLAINDNPHHVVSYLQINDFNPVNTNEHIAMGIHSDRLGANANDGFIYELNSFPIGQNNQHDAIGIGGGTVGTFYYQNNTLTGLTDDVANNLLSGSDAIVLINDYVSNTLNPMDIEYSYIQSTSIAHNRLIGLYFAYSTPCEPFDVSVTNDTTICRGSQLQLEASSASSSSATTYEWSPAIGLSCTDCPNPVLTADSTRLYTVRIFNNDSCSVIRPVMVHVKDNPVFQSVAVQPTVCGNSTGVITVSPSTGLIYSIDNSNWQTEAVFNQLHEGNYIVQIEDVFGCRNDTTVYLGNVNLTEANFSVTPETGSAPLDVVVSNNSNYATDFLWLIDGELYSGDLFNHTFDSSGVYQITLIAYNNIPACADTLSLNVIVYDSMVVTLPNVFTPNGDGINDFFSITSNQDADYEFFILNRWGNTIVQGKGKLIATIPAVIWDGASIPNKSGQAGSSPVADGVYFIHLKIVNPLNGEAMEFQEFITVKN